MATVDKSGKMKTRGMKFAEAKIVQIARGGGTELEIKGTQIFDSAMLPLCAYLCTEDCKCEALCLHSNGFSSHGFRILAFGIGRNKTLRTFSYGSNLIGGHDGSVSDIFFHSIGAGPRPDGEEEQQQEEKETEDQFLNAAILDLEKALTQNETIVTLNLEANQLGDWGARAIANAIKVNKVLRNVRIGTNRITNAGGMLLAEAIAAGCDLESFDLDENFLEGEAAAKIIVAGAACPSLTEMSFRANRLSESCGEQIAEALKENPHLRSVNLRRNSLRDDGVVKIAEVLDLPSCALTAVHLGSNRVGCIGSGRIAQALEHNSTLTELSLDINIIDDDGAQGLSVMLEKNKTLTSLDLAMNQFTLKGYLRLAEAVQLNSTLTSLGLSSSFVSCQKQVELIQQRIRSNVEKQAKAH